MLPAGFPNSIVFLFMTIAKQKHGEAFVSPIEIYLDDHNLLSAFSSGDTFTSRPLGEDVAVKDLLS